MKRKVNRHSLVVFPQSHLDPVDDLVQLVDSLAGIVGLASLVRGTEVSPLEAVDRTQIPLLSVRESALVQELSGAVPIPDPDALLLQLLRIRAAANEPQQLFGHSSPEHPLSGQQWEDVVPQVKSHLSSENGQSADAGAIPATIPSVDDVLDQVQVLHLVSVLRHMVSILGLLLVLCLFHFNHRRRFNALRILTISCAIKLFPPFQLEFFSHSIPPLSSNRPSDPLRGQ